MSMRLLLPSKWPSSSPGGLNDSRPYNRPDGTDDVVNGAVLGDRRLPRPRGVADEHRHPPTAYARFLHVWRRVPRPDDRVAAQGLRPAPEPEDPPQWSSSTSPALRRSLSNAATTSR